MQRDHLTSRALFAAESSDSWHGSSLEVSWKSVLTPIDCLPIDSIERFHVCLTKSIIRATTPDRDARSWSGIIHFVSWSHLLEGRVFGFILLNNNDHALVRLLKNCEWNESYNIKKYRKRVLHCAALIDLAILISFLKIKNIFLLPFITFCIQQWVI